MSKISWKGSTLLAPLPAVMVSCSDGEKDNVFTAAWTGIINSQPPKLYVSIRPERYSHEIISKSREFAVNLVNSSLVRACDICGVRSGRDCDKFELCALEKEEAKEISAPILALSPLAIECKVCDIVPLGSHDMFIADIVSVDVNEELLDEDGKLHMEKASLVSFTHGEYFAQGKKLGSIGYSVRKKRKKQHNGK